MAHPRSRRSLTQSKRAAPRPGRATGHPGHGETAAHRADFILAAVPLPAIRLVSLGARAPSLRSRRSLTARARFRVSDPKQTRCTAGRSGNGPPGLPAFCRGLTFRVTSTVRPSVNTRARPAPDRGSETGAFRVQSSFSRRRLDLLPLPVVSYAYERISSCLSNDCQDRRRGHRLLGVRLLTV